jgi:hypothetical protein
MAELAEQFQKEDLDCDTGLFIITLTTNSPTPETVVCLRSWGNSFAIDGIIQGLSSGSIPAGGWAPQLLSPPEDFEESFE